MPDGHVRSTIYENKEFTNPLNSFSTVKPDSVDVLAPILLRYKAAHAAGAILHVSFSTVSEYFWLLRAACECLANVGPRAMLYLAAAVSDFYIPKDRVVRYYMCPSQQYRNTSGYYVQL